MFYKLIELINTYDTFHLFATYPSHFNLSHITKRAGEYRSLDELYAELCKLVDVFLTHDDRTVFFNEGIRMKRYLSKLFKVMQEQKTGENRTDYSDDMIKLYRKTTREYQGNKTLDKHIQFVTE